MIVMSDGSGDHRELKFERESKQKVMWQLRRERWFCTRVVAVGGESYGDANLGLLLEQLITARSTVRPTTLLLVSGKARVR
jgi:hypothetical protein